MPSLTLPLPAALAALALVVFVAVLIGAVCVNGRRFVGPWVIDRRTTSEPAQRAAVVRVEHVTRSAPRLGNAPVIPLRPLDNREDTEGGDRS